MKKSRKSASKCTRMIQQITGIHRIHHIHYSYGWKIPFLGLAIFTDKFSHLDGRTHGVKRIKSDHYHNCTKTGTY